jgi:hypothetical protein
MSAAFVALQVFQRHSSSTVLVAAQAVRPFHLRDELLQIVDEP